MTFTVETLTLTALAAFIDMLALAILVVAAIFGASYGLRKQLATPLALIAALIFSYFFQPVMRHLLAAGFGDSAATTVAAWMISAPVSFFLFSGLWTLLISKLFAANATSLDRGLGAVFGLLKGGIIAGVIVGFLTYLSTEDLRAHSRAVRYLHAATEKIRDTKIAIRARDFIAEIADEKKGKTNLPAPGKNQLLPETLKRK